MSETAVAAVAVPEDISADVIFDLAHTRRIELDLSYAGAVTPPEAWSLHTRRLARLVDVRTAPEFRFVGSVPRSINIEWHGGDEEPVAEFLERLGKLVRRDEPVLLLCRSAVRSDAAARAATAAGFTRVYNVLEGFEGKRNAAGHRGELDGWRKHGLPWLQD
jgi:rhodanese-related sulfurtransferase